MKKIAFIKGNSKYGTLRVYSDLLIDELRRRKNEVVVIDRLNQGEYEKIDEILDDSFWGVMSYQMLAFKVKGTLDEKKKYLPDLKFISLCGDHPIYTNYWLNKMKNNNQAYLLISDVNQYPYIKEYYPWLKVNTFTSIVGKGLPDAVRYSEKQIDVFFGGTYREMEIQERIIEAMPPIDSKVATFAIDTILKNKGMTLESAVHEALKFFGIHVEKHKFSEYLEKFIPVDRYIRDYYRYSLLDAILERGIKVHLYGDNWNKSKYVNNSNVIILEGEVTLEQGFFYMANSRIILNMMPWSRIGFHDRVLNALLAHAVCVTNTNEIVDCTFKNDVELITYDLDEMNKAADKIMYLLNNNDIAEKISEAGYQKAITDFSISSYCESVFQSLEEIL